MSEANKPKGEIKNAIIESADIDDADRGMLTAWLRLKYDCGGQGFGGYALYLPKSYKHHELKSVAGHFIWRCMEIAGVASWDDLAGKTVRVDAEHSCVHGVGHITNNDWFYPADDFSAETERHNDMLALVDRVANLNKDAGEIGEGMLNQLVDEARRILGRGK